MELMEKTSGSKILSIKNVSPEKAKVINNEINKLHKQINDLYSEKRILERLIKAEISLPSSCNTGEIFEVMNPEGNGWILIQGSNQRVHFGDMSTTIGPSGYMESTDGMDCLEIMCIAKDTFVVKNCVGNITIV